MADSVEKWGDDIDSAVELALRDLKLTRDEVIVTVLEEPSKGFLGLFGSKLARVRVERKPAEEKKPPKPVETKVQEFMPEPEDEPEEDDSLEADFALEEEAQAFLKERDRERDREHPRTAKKHSSPKHSTREGKNKKNSKSNSQVKYHVPKMMTKFTLTEEDTDAIPAQDAPAVKFVEEIAKSMDLNITAEAGIKDSTLYINLVGPDVGSLIGKRGQTMDAIQYLSSIVQNKDGEKHIRVIINAEKYREKREKTLQLLARKMADKAVRVGKNVRLEPMNPYERKVIHSTLQYNSRVTTRSEGVEPNRRVIIELIKK